MKELILGMFICVFFNSNAQSNLVKGSKYVTLKYGASKYSAPKFGMLDYGICYKEKMVFETGVFFETGNVRTTAFNNYGITADFMFNLFDVKQVVFGNVGVGGFGQLEFIHSTRDNFKNQTLVYGGRIITEVDYLINDKWSLKGEFSEWYAAKSKLGNWFWSATVGVSLTLN